MCHTVNADAFCEQDDMSEALASARHIVHACVSLRNDRSIGISTVHWFVHTTLQMLVDPVCNASCYKH